MKEVKKHVLSCRENLAKLRQQMKFIYNNANTVLSEVVLVLKLMEPLISGAQCDIASALGEIHNLERAEQEAEMIKE